MLGNKTTNSNWCIKRFSDF